MNYRNHIKTAKYFTLRNLATRNLSLVLWLLLSSPFTALADKTANITVSATLLATCTIGGLPNAGGVANFGTLNFGSLIALNRSISTITSVNNGSIQVQCSKGTSFNVTLSGGNSGDSNARYLLSEKLGERAFYNLYSDISHTTVWNNITGVTTIADGKKTIIPIYAVLPEQATPTPDVYTDTIEVKITW